MKRLRKKRIPYRRVLFVLADLIGITVACLVGYSLLTFWSESSMPSTHVVANILLYALSTIVSLTAFGGYHKLWRYATVRDYFSSFLGVLLSTPFSICLAYLLRISGPGIYYFITCSLTMITIVGMRVVYRLIRETGNGQGAGLPKKRTLIVGGGAACNMMLPEMLSNASSYFPVGIVDDDPVKWEYRIQGVRIYGGLDRIPELCETLRIHTVFVAIPSCTSEQRDRIMKICSQTGCAVKMLPFLHELMFNGNLMGQAKTIKMEDLLGRPVMQMENLAVLEFVRDKVCMVTGGGGSIGSELCRQIIRYNPKRLVIVDIYENNAYAIQQELIRQYRTSCPPLSVEIASVRDYETMNHLFRRYQPQIVFHAAAHKHVPLMEVSPEEAVKNNVFGTFNVASLAEFYQVERFVLISTDKAVNPTNVMGATKRCCEMIVQYMMQESSKTEFVAVRFGNVLGSNGSVIPLFRQQIEQGGPVTVTHPDIIRYFMTIPEAVSLVLLAGAMAHGGEIFVLDMGQPVKIQTLAENLIRFYGYEPNVDIMIEYSGLRPGEKLFEELLMSEEGLKPTYNEKIFIGNQIPVDGNTFVKQLTKLKECALHHRTEEMLEVLKEIVPTFYHKTADAAASSPKEQMREQPAASGEPELPALAVQE